MASPVGGYVLAGGKSSRMGRDKAFMELGGKPLIAHAVGKLQRICGDVHVLGGNPDLADYAPVLHDLHPACGPLSGIATALAHSQHDWNLILPVDVPFLPAAYLDWWVRTIVQRRGARLGMFRVQETPQPAILMIHSDLATYLSTALERGEYKLLSVLQEAAEDIAAMRELRVGTVLFELPIDQNFRFTGTPWASITSAQQRDKMLWFANLNTPEDFAAAELHVDALEP
jgi:molybdopterin-guanine dinucleotide biosynthesis protein A